MKTKAVIHTFLIISILLPNLCIGTSSLMKTDSLTTDPGDQLYAKAEEFLKNRAYDSAAYYYQKSIDAFESVKKWEDAFNVENRYARLLRRMRKSQEIIDRLSEVIKKADSLKVDSSIYVIQAHEKLGVQLGDIGLHGKALFHMQKNLEGYQQKYRQDSAKYIVVLTKAYNNIAVSLMQSNRYELADIYFDSAVLALNKSPLKDSELEQVIYLNKGNINRSMGYYYEAEGYYQKSLSMLDVPSINQFEKGISWWYYGTMFLYRNRDTIDQQKAIQYTDSAFKYVENSQLEIYCRYQYGNAYTNMGQHQQAIDQFNIASQLIEKYYGNSYHELAELSVQMADVYLHMDSTELAIKYANTALRQYDELDSESKEGKALAFITLGKGYVQQNQLEKALGFYQQSISQISPGFVPENNLINPSEEHLVKSLAIYEALKRKTIVLKKLFQNTGDFKYLESELACYELMIESINLGKNDLVALESKMTYNEKGYDVYKSAVLSAMEAFKVSNDNYYLEKAFQYCYKSKARELINRIFYASHRNNESRSHNDVLLKITDLKTEIGNLKKDIAFATDSLLKSKLEENLFASSEQLRILTDSVNHYNPKTNRLKEGNLNIEAFSEKLAKNKCLLIEFMEIDDQLIVFSLGKNLNASLIPYPDAVKDSIASYKVAMENRDFNPQLSHFIYQQLIEPVVKDKQKEYQSLLLIPDGIATTISFESLVSSPPGNRNEISYLLEDFDISYNYSSLLNNLVKDSDDFDYTFVGFSPDYGNYSSQALAVRGISSGSQLPPLPSAQKEVAGIADMFDGKLLSGNDATEANFNDLAKNTKYLHLAAHAFSNNSDPLLSRVVLNDSNGGDDDGDLFAYEIYNMDLNSDLVVLSACNTGTGKYQKGAGVISLASSFKYAGSKNLITSLWSVPDQPTAVIMSSFYRYLNEGKTKASALRSAKLDYLKNADATTRSPYYWSGFILIGELEETETSQFLWWLIAGIAFLAVLAFIKFRK